MKVLFTKKEFLALQPKFKIGAIISDGMWYSHTKWRKLAKVSEDELNSFIDEHLKTGDLLQSDTEEKSFRFCLDAIEKWHYENNISTNAQLVDFLFPADERIWDGMTEVDGFLNAPRRELGSVTFNCGNEAAKEIITALKGIARVREESPGEYRAYGLSAVYIKQIIEDILAKYNKGTEDRTTYARHVVYRREMVDFTPEFKRGLTVFYKNFSRSLVDNRMSTIAIFLPEKEDQESQIIEWVIAAIEKFDETVAVPFSGYLSNVLKHWPMDLPINALGKPLAEFQRNRAKAVQSLTDKFPGRNNFTFHEIAEELEMDIASFIELENSHKVWGKLKNSTTLTWDESAEEKESLISVTGGDLLSNNASKNVQLANKISKAIIDSALETDLFEDAYRLINQIDSSDLNFSKLKEISPEFIQELGIKLGVI